MAFSVAKQLSTTAGRMLMQCRNAPSVSLLSKSVLSAQKQGQLSRPFTRSMWYLCKHSSRNGDLTPVWEKATARTAPPKPCSCGCAGMHTQGDTDLANFLESEIKLESDSRQFPNIPDIPDFKLSQEGTIATLTKSKDAEIVKVIFNVNHSIEEEPRTEPAEAEEESGSQQLRSYPEFTVEITKDSQSSLSIGCRFELTDSEGVEGEDQPEMDDAFLIDEVRIYDGKIEESTFTVGSEVMDANLYDFVMMTLEERGITAEFVKQLSDLASALEHRLYIEFLQKFHGIAKS